MSATTTPSVAPLIDSDEGSKLAARRAGIERIVYVTLRACAWVSVLTTVGIVLVLLTQSFGFFREVSLWEYFTGTKWTPVIEPPKYGVLPLVCGTVLVAGGAAVIAIPLGLGTAIYLSEYASPVVRDIVKPLLEILGGIPSVVFGYVAVVFVSPVIKQIFPSASLFNAANACVVVGIMILPMIISLSEEVLRSVPRSLREGAYALGATKLDVTMGVIVPAALSGIFAACLLAIARAVGETMAVSMACGSTKQMTLNPLESVQTMTAYIVEITKGDIVQGSMKYNTIFAVGLTLFVMTLVLNTFAQWVLSRMREQYE